MDFSFMDEISDEGEESDDDDDDEFEADNVHVTASDTDGSYDWMGRKCFFVSGFAVVDRSKLQDFENTRPDPPLIRGTGRVLPKVFNTPSGKVEVPLSMFTGRTRGLFKRYTLPVDPGKFVVHTDGACRDNGLSNPQAGWAFWHGDSAMGDNLVVSGRLEKKGPFGDDAEQTSNRAELRAVIAALRYQSPPWPGLHTIVIATDSTYVVSGATDWARKWVKPGKHNWQRRDRRGRWWPVKNRDLWQALLGEVERYHDSGMKVEFWNIPREWNEVADKAAKEAAAQAAVPEQWTEG